MIRRFNLSGNPNIGVAIACTDQTAIIPPHLEDKELKLIDEALEVPLIKTPINGSNLAGALVVGNSRGFVVSKFAFDREIDKIKKAGLKVEKIPDRFTAVGNIILANDNGALVNPLLSDKSIELISSTLDIDVERGSIANFKINGSVAVATNKGILVHPATNPEEIKFLEKIFKVPADVGTVNRGTSLVGACTVANSNGVIVGQDTTGPEMARIEESLGFLEEYI
jgi:translation initiation factor 6